MFRSKKYQIRDTMVLADLIASDIVKYNITKCFIDGDGVGGGVVDRLSQMGFKRKVIEIKNASTPNKPHIYANKRRGVQHQHPLTEARYFYFRVPFPEYKHPQPTRG
jgi:hypothetical protein